MRRSVTKLTFLATATALLAVGTGCEDGPAQTFSAAPTGAGGVWNGPPGGAIIPSDGGSYVSTATQGTDAQVGGQNANDLCTAATEKEVWSANFTAPIQPPGIAGGLDIAGGYYKDSKGNYIAGASGYDPNCYSYATCTGASATHPTYDATQETWTGATVEQAEAVLCQGTADSIYYGETNTLGWGESLEFSVQYNTNNREITDLLFGYGYIGTSDATSADGKTSYSISMNNIPIKMKTASGTTDLLFDWSSEASLNAQVNALYDAYRFTYNPSFPKDTDCIASGHCIVGNNFGEGGYIWFTPLNLTFYVNTTVGTPQANSIPTLVDLGLLKVLPFSNATVTLQLDSAGVGPHAIQTKVGGTNATCDYVLGQTFATFDSTCLEVFPMGDPQNTIAKNKLFGAIGHGDEEYIFDIAGVDPQFTATLQPLQVVSDAQRPTAADVAWQLTVDQEVLGVIANDFTNNDATQPQDFHGIGMVTLEWANLVQQYMKANAGVTSDLGDPDCIANPAAPGVSGKVCSGLEGIVTSAPPALAPASMAVNALGANAVTVDPTLGVGLKPGTWYSVFCSGSGTANGKGYTGCIGGVNGGFYFDTMVTAVAAAFPQLQPASPVIAEALQDRRFFFQEWVLAFVRYLETADKPNTTLAQIDANLVDENELFFDSAGGGFDTAEYVDRLTVTSGNQAPTSVSITTNLTTSVMNDYDFQRYNFRGEKALYTAFTTNPTDKPGAEPLFLTNIVGSPVLQSVYGAYECAIDVTGTDTNCSGAPAPVDTSSPLSPQPPLYAPYEGAFGASILNIAANGSSPTPSPITIQTTAPGANLEFEQSALVTLPIFKNPYDLTSPQMGSITELIPYVPEGANVGFPVTIDGSRDKFYNTFNVDFSGTTVDGNLDYEYVAGVDANGKPIQNLIVRAMETQNYLGLVFACAEPNPANPMLTDILSVRMYQNAADILNWVSTHPASTNDCGIQIKYSIYGNYADYISSLTNGVRFGLNAEYGGAVVTDVTLFDPNVVAALGQ